MKNNLVYSFIFLVMIFSTYLSLSASSSNSMQPCYTVRDSILSEINVPMYVYKIGSIFYVTGLQDSLRITEVSSDGVNGIPKGQFLRFYRVEIKFT